MWILKTTDLIVKFLANYLDTQLSWNKHIEELNNKICKKIYTLQKFGRSVVRYNGCLFFHNSFTAIIRYHSMGSQIWMAAKSFCTAEKSIKSYRKITIWGRYEAKIHRTSHINFAFYTYLWVYSVHKETHRTFWHSRDLSQPPHKICNNLAIPCHKLKKVHDAHNMIGIKLFNTIQKNVQHLEIGKLKMLLKRVLLDNAFYTDDEFLGSQIPWRKYFTAIKILIVIFLFIFYISIYRLECFCHVQNTFSL